jgi:hypothetical protein
VELNGAHSVHELPDVGPIERRRRQYPGAEAAVHLFKRDKSMPPDIIDPHAIANVSEPRLQNLLRTGVAKGVFLQGVFPFAGRGFFSAHSLNDSLAYEVPADCRAELVYFRGGNMSDDLLYLTVSANGKPIRYFPVGPKSDFHVPLAIVESHPAGTRFEIGFASPRGITGSIVVDAGFVEYPEGV